jgi:hypothetical protein
LALAGILDLDPSDALRHSKNLAPWVPIRAEGWFAIVSDHGLSTLFPEIKDAEERNCAGIKLIIDKIALSRPFENFKGNEITPERLRVHGHTRYMLNLITRNQPGDILILPGQLGRLHRGCSTRRTWERFEPNEFGLGSVACGSIILAHPNRLARQDELEMDCPGDIILDPDTDPKLVRCPFFDFYDGKVRYVAVWCGHTYYQYGSITAFVPDS